MNDSTHPFPADFIARDLQVSIRNNNIGIRKNGKSTYFEYTEKDLWDEEILDDTYDIYEKIKKYNPEVKILTNKITERSQINACKV